MVFYSVFQLYNLFWSYLFYIYAYGVNMFILIPAQIGRSFVISKLKDYPQFRSIAIAIHGSGFKVCKVHISLRTDFCFLYSKT